jgi:hypothetical protein
MATKWSNVPKLTDDVVKSAKEDAAKAKKGRDVDASKLTGGAKEAVREAGKRAFNRNVGRAGAGQAAFSGGYELGRKIDEEGIPFTDGVGKGVGKKLVDKLGINSQNNRRNKVELSKSAKERLEDMDTDRVMSEVNDERKARKYAEKDKPTEYRGDDEYKKGGLVRGWGMARGARKAKMR